MDNLKVAQHTKQLDGIEYELTVRDELSRYFGAWFCRKCWKGGIKYDWSSTVEEALVLAERGASLHHEREHRLLSDGS